MEHPVREVIRLGAQWVSRRGTDRPARDEVTPGRWNRLETNGPVDGLRLEMAHPLHITGLEVSITGSKSLAARIRLAEAPDIPKGLLTMVFTVTAPDGRQVGGQEATVSTRTRDLTMEIPLTEAAKGNHRLKVTLCMDELVLDNARLEINL